MEDNNQPSNDKQKIRNLIIAMGLLDYRLTLVEILAGFVLTILFCVGITLHYLTQPQSILLTWSEGFLFFCNLIVTTLLLIRSWIQEKKSFAPLCLWVISCFVLTILIEIVGVRTGIIFGNYKYGTTFDLQIFNVPWVIGWNWVLVIAGITIMSRTIYEFVVTRALVQIISLPLFIKINHNPWFGLVQNLIIACISGGFAVLFDIPLEQVAIQFDFWQWENSIIPIQNYLAWFTITFVFSLYALRFKVFPYSRLIVLYTLLQATFFVILAY